MVRKSFFEKLLKFRCPSCGAVDNNKLAFRMECSRPSKDEKDNGRRDFSVVVRCKCGKVCKAFSMPFDGLTAAQQDAAEDTFMSLLFKG
jgi:hypothetical protein